MRFLCLNAFRGDCFFPAIFLSKIDSRNPLHFLVMHWERALALEAQSRFCQLIHPAFRLGAFE